MRKVLFLIMILIPALSLANEKKAVAILDRTVAQIKADVGVQMDFEYTISDVDDAVLYTDKGTLYMQNSGDMHKYSLWMGQMKIWCNGEKVWSYTKETEEIYITSAHDDESQYVSPIRIMELYKHGYKCTHADGNSVDIITLIPEAHESDLSKVIVYIDKKTSLPTKLCMQMGGNGNTEIIVSNYKGNCTFDNSKFVCPLKDFPEAEVIDMQ